MDEYTCIIFIMATTIHVPTGLLECVDRRAKELGISRNRYIVQALEKTIEEEERWSKRFLRALNEAAQDTEGRVDIDEMAEAISSSRTRKGPPKL